MRERTCSQTLLPVIFTLPGRAAGLSPAGHRANASVPLRDRGIGPGKWTSPALRPAESRYTSGTPAWGPVKTRAFPHFFPQLWKTSGGAPMDLVPRPSSGRPEEGRLERRGDGL